MLMFSLMGILVNRLTTSYEHINMLPCTSCSLKVSTNSMNRAQNGLNSEQVLAARSNLATSLIDDVHLKPSK